MARRSSSNSAFEIVLIGVGLAVLAVIALVPFAFALLVYGLPLLIVWMIVPGPATEEPVLVLDTSVYPLLAQLRARQRRAESQFTRIRDGDHGVRWSDNLDRFEERSRKGQELNEQLRHWGAEFETASQLLKDAEAPNEHASNEWANAVRKWYHHAGIEKAKQSTWKNAISAFLCAWIVGEVIGMGSPDFMSWFRFAWNPAPEFLHPALSWGAIAGWTTTFFSLRSPSIEFENSARRKIGEFIEAKRSREAAEDGQYCSEEPDDEEARSSRTDDDFNAIPWHQTLNVDPKSQPDTIKAAYKKAAMECHPDRVAHMSERIRAAAEEEMRRVNEAFEQARVARGF